MVTGRPLALLGLECVICTNLGSLQGNVKANRERYGNEFIEYPSKVRHKAGALLPPPRGSWVQQ